MSPNYADFIRFQDKIVILLFYSILLVILGFYWKNNNYSLTQNDAWSIGVILSIVVHNTMYDLKAYWAYSFTIKRVNINVFAGKTSSPTETFLSRPPVIGIISIFVFWAMVKVCLLVTTTFYAIFYLYLVAPLYIYLIFRWLRSAYIRQLPSSVCEKTRYKHLYRYVASYVLLLTTLNLLAVRVLAGAAQFSREQGFLSVPLIVAMTLLCAIVLALNLALSVFPKRYILLGRIFLNEIDLLFSKSVLCPSLCAKPFPVRMLLLIIILPAWIIGVSGILSLLDNYVPFEIYFLLCFMPCIGYFFLHTYWRWHQEFMISCDMYFRYGVIEKRELSMKMK